MFDNEVKNVFGDKNCAEFKFRCLHHNIQNEPKELLQVCKVQSFLSRALFYI